MKMEYYGYPSLAELFVYGELHIKIWEQIIDKLMNIVALFRRYKGKVSLDEYQFVYLKKTKNRLDELITTFPDFGEILQYEKIFLNEEFLMNIHSLFPFIEKEVNRFYDDAEKNNCFIHGDFCFSNILFDLKSGIIRLIDPRGIWSESVYGDIRYDIAKLRHSVSGKYDLIMNDFFTINREKNSFEMVIFSSSIHDCVKNILDNYVIQFWDINQIKLIEALLFISMIPLHNDNKDKQFAMYCTGLKILNEVYNEKSKK